MLSANLLEKACYSTIRIETQKSSSGAIAEGTAFVYEYKTEDNTYPFLVTARSVIASANEGRMTLLQAKDGKPFFGKPYTLDIEHFEKLWYTHPDEAMDIAVTPFVPFVKHIETSGTPIYFNSLIQDHGHKKVNIPDIGLADDVVYIGYPHELWDMKSLLPVVRKAIVATPVNIDYFGKKEFLVDTTVPKGSDGSPVFQLKEQSADDAKQVKPILLGMLVPAGAHTIGGKKDILTETSRNRSMGIVIRTDAILEAITAYLHEKGFI